MAELYRIVTDYATGNIEVSGGVVVKAEHIFRRFFGRLFSNVQAWAEANGYKIEPVPPGEK